MQDDIDYYTSLNLQNSASPKEIKDRFLKLSRVLHPDKQHSEYKPLAEKVFTRIKTYTEILLNPTLRYIYDNFGHEGVSLVSNKKYLHRLPIDAESNKLVRPT